MYIFELIAKLIKNTKPQNRFQYEMPPEVEYEKCDHIFIPIDSTKTILACSKCGHVVKNEGQQ